MSIEAFVTAWLGRDPDVQEIAGSRIYPVELPQGAGLPALTYYRTGQQGMRSLAGLSGLSRARLTIDCWATSYSDAKGLAAAIRGTWANPKLDGYRGQLAGVFVQTCLCTNEMDLIERPVHGDEAGVKHVALDFDIVFEDLDSTVFSDREPYSEPE